MLFEKISWIQIEINIKLYRTPQLLLLWKMTSTAHFSYPANNPEKFCHSLTFVSPVFDLAGFLLDRLNESEIRMKMMGE
jgi:hypothetical protein